MKVTGKYNLVLTYGIMKLAPGQEDFHNIKKKYFKIEI